MERGRQVREAKARSVYAFFDGNQWVSTAIALAKAAFCAGNGRAGVALVASQAPQVAPEVAQVASEVARIASEVGRDALRVGQDGHQVTQGVMRATSDTIGVPEIRA